MPSTRSFAGRWLQRATGAIGMLTAGASLAAFAGTFHWTFDLLSHFRVQYVVVLLVVAVVTLAGRGWKSLAVWLVVLAVNAAVIAPLYLPASTGHETISEPSPSLTLVHFNVHFSRSDGAELAQWIDAQHADIIFLQEVTPALLHSVTPELKRYRLIAADARPSPWGVAALHALDSKTPIASTRVVELARGRPVVEVIADLAGRPVGVLSLHTSLPFLESYDWQKAEFESAATWVAQQKLEGRAAVVIGDFNTTRWSAGFRRLLRQMDLHDARQGFGVGTTWPMGLPLPMRIAIDQCVHTAELVTRDFSVLNANGSDHLPLRVELGWR